MIKVILSLALGKSSLRSTSYCTSYCQTCSILNGFKLSVKGQIKNLIIEYITIIKMTVLTRLKYTFLSEFVQNSSLFRSETVNLNNLAALLNPSNVSVALVWKPVN